MISYKQLTRVCAHEETGSNKWMTGMGLRWPPLSSCWMCCLWDVLTAGRAGGTKKKKTLSTDFRGMTVISAGRCQEVYRSFTRRYERGGERSDFQNWSRGYRKKCYRNFSTAKTEKIKASIKTNFYKFKLIFDKSTKTFHNIFSSNCKLTV